jgi:hypothetical protein
MAYSLNDHIDLLTSSSESTNDDMKFQKKSIEELSHMDVLIADKYFENNLLEQYKTMFDGFAKRINDNLTRISNFLQKHSNESNIQPDQIKKLKDSKKLDKESLQIIIEIQENIKHMQDNINNTRVSNLRTLSLLALQHSKYKPKNDQERKIIDHVAKEAKRCIALRRSSKKGGLQRRKNKTNNKNYTKKRTLNIYK